MKKLIILISLLVTISFLASAQTQTQRADVREGSEQARIHEGRQNGELTNREAHTLNTEQRHIRRSERRAKADGEVTPQEKARIERKQNRASRDIRRKKHNGRTE